MPDNHFHAWEFNDHRATLAHHHNGGHTEHNHPGLYYNVRALLSATPDYDYDSTVAGPTDDRSFTGYPTLREPT